MQHTDQSYVIYTEYVLAPDSPLIHVTYGRKDTSELVVIFIAIFLLIKSTTNNKHIYCFLFSKLIWY